MVATNFKVNRKLCNDFWPQTLWHILQNVCDIQLRRILITMPVQHGNRDPTVTSRPENFSEKNILWRIRKKEKFTFYLISLLKVSILTSFEYFALIRSQVKYKGLVKLSFLKGTHIFIFILESGPYILRVHQGEIEELTPWRHVCILKYCPLGCKFRVGF